MPQPSNTYATNDMVGIREDLADVIYNIAPTMTPFMNMIPHVSASNVNHEWQTDSLASAANNAVIEGDDATTDASTPTVRLGNRCQISDKVARVTGTARAVNTAGRGDELDYQVMKRAKELRRDMETALLANKAKVTGDDTTAPELAGIGAWIATNVDKASDGTNPSPVDGTDPRNDGTARAFTEDQLKTVLVSVFDEGGEPDCLMVGPFNRQIVSSFGSGTKFQKVEDMTLHTSFDVYDSDFGQLKIIPNRFQVGSQALILDMDMWALAHLPGREFVTEELAKTGDSDRKQILSEYTLEARQEKSSGMVADLTTS